MYVYMYARTFIGNTFDNFRKSQRRKFIFGPPIHLDVIRVRFLCEGHRVKVKVTGAKKGENPYYHNRYELLFDNTHSREVCA